MVERVGGLEEETLTLVLDVLKDNARQGSDQTFNVRMVGY